MKIVPAQVQFREGGIPFSEAFDDIYFSPEGGVAETTHVFIAGNSLRERWIDPGLEASDFVIGETGFGTGLNFLVALQEWRASGAAERGNRLTFVSCELYPLRIEDLKRAHEFFPEFHEISDLLQRRYPVLIEGLHWIHFPEFSADLGLYIGDSSDFFEKLSTQVDAWFLDGFAPSKNPQMWGERMASSLARLSRSGTTAATFSVSAAVKKPLKNAGFFLEKRKGFGRKREMLTAVFRGESSDHSLKSPPFLPEWSAWQSVRVRSSAQIAVVGGGLAGCMMAGALARRGVEVTLIERRDALCSEASGNPAGIFMPYFTAGANPASDFGLTAFSYFSRHWDLWWKGVSSPVGQVNGVLQIVDPQERERIRQGVERLGLEWDQSFVRELSHSEFAQKSGFSLNPHSSSQAIFELGHGGWTRAGALAQTQIAHSEQIRVILGSEVVAVNSQPIGNTPQVRIQLSDGRIREFDSVILACAHTLRQTLGWDCGIQVHPLRGQVGEIDVAGQSDWRLTQALSYDGYIAPIDSTGRGRWSIGSTFDLRDYNESLVPEKNEGLLRKLTDQFQLPFFENATRGKAFDSSLGRVGFRCTTLDKIPMIGPLGDPSRFALLYSNELRGGKRSAQAHTESSSKDWIARGVHAFVGFGSRGINWIPLAAEILASELAGGVSRLTPDQQIALSPSRFLARDVRRGVQFTSSPKI